MTYKRFIHSSERILRSVLSEALAVVARRIYFDIIKVINDTNLIGIYIGSEGAEALIAAN